MFIRSLKKKTKKQVLPVTLFIQMINKQPLKFQSPQFDWIFKYIQYIQYTYCILKLLKSFHRRMTYTLYFLNHYCVIKGPT